MAKSQNKKKSPNSSWIAFLKDHRFHLSLGIFLLILTLILTLALVSFLFTWRIDQSIEWSNLFVNREVQAANWSSKIGAILANTLINKWFGLASFSIPFLIGLIGLKLLDIKLLPLGPTLRNVLFISIWFSIFLSFLFGDANGYFGSGPGGEHGLFMASWLKTLIGPVGTFFLLMLILFVFLVFAYPRFLPFLKDKIAALRNKGQQVKEANTASSNQAGSVPANLNEPDLTIEIPEEELAQDQDKRPELKSKNLLEDLDDFEVAKPEEEESLPLPEAFTPDNSDINADFDSDEDEELPEEMGEYDPTLDLSDFEMPGFEILEDHRSDSSEVSKDELLYNKNKIIETLQNYKIKIEKIKATIGPTITLYEIVPAPGIRIAKIKNLEDDIAMSLAALGIRIIAPMPGKGTIGIEVPNQNPEIVSMRSILASSKYQDTKFDLPVALGKTISNETFVFDLTKMPHLLVAGATGQGKSVGLNAIIASILYKKHPSEVKFVLVDPKKVELTLYTAIEKHYLAKLPESDEAIITDTQKVVQTLNSLTVEMDNRYNLLKKAHVRNIKEYNAKFRDRRLNPEKGHRFLPYIVLIIDEFADLIMTAGKEIEMPIARIAQLARAIGIHLIIATQRPSTNIITGVIKANFPARIAFRVSSMIDSRTILDTPGANQLIGRGDLLFSTGGDLVRVQCAFIDTPELERLAEYIGNQRAFPEPYLLPEYEGEGGNEVGEVDLSKRDELFDDAARLIVMHQQGSTSLIQRKFSIGYNRAGRIMDQLEAAGIVGGSEGSKPRQVLYQDEYSLEHFLKSLN